MLWENQGMDRREQERKTERERDATAAAAAAALAEEIKDKERREKRPRGATERRKTQEQRMLPNEKEQVTTEATKHDDEKGREKVAGGGEAKLRGGRVGAAITGSCW